MPLVLTFTLFLLGVTSISAVRVVLSLYALELGASASDVGLIMSALYIFPLALSWSIGGWGDRAGARWLVMVGNVAAILGLLVPFAWRALPSLYVGAVLTGLSFPFYNVLLQNVVGLLSTPETRAQNFGTSSMVASSANLVGPLMAGIAIDAIGGAHACLAMIALPVAGSALLLFHGRHLPGPTRHADTGQRPPTNPLGDRKVLRVLLIGALVQLGNDVFQIYMPVYGHDKGLSGSAIGAVLATFAIASVLVRFAMPRLVRRLGEHGLIAWSFLASAVAFGVAPFCASGITLAAVAFLFGIAMGCGHPVTTMLMFSQSARGRSGATLGLRQTINNVVRVSAPALLGMLAAALGMASVFWLNGLMMIGGGWLARSAEA